LDHKINLILCKNKISYLTPTQAHPSQTSQLMLFKDISAVWCHNHTEHKYTVWAECRRFER